MSATSAQRRHACDFCDLRFKDATTLKIHRNNKHTHDETHVCDHCAAVFYTKYKLDTHLASKHGINDGFKCEKCKRYLKSAFTLLKHTRKCSATPCPVCGKEFMSKWKLGNHVKGHMDTKSHICDECGKDFLHNFTLVEHIEIVHQGKRPYTCTRCDKTFSRAGNLRAHKLIHTGVRPFPCNLCEKECREKIQLIKHLRSKHGVEDNQMHNFVKIVPKKEIVQNEDMKNLLQNITSIKNEPVVEEPFDVKRISFKIEPMDQEVEKHSEKQSNESTGCIPFEFETTPDKNSITKKIAQSVENMSNISMKQTDDKIREKNDDPDMADESDFIKEMEANELNNLIKEFEDDDMKNDVVEMKATEGKQLKLNVNEPKVMKEKEVKEEINKSQEIVDIEEHNIEADENLEEFKFERIEF